MFPRLLLGLLMLIGGSASTSAAEPSVQAEQLPRVPPTGPDKAVSTFRVKPGFRIELVAAEPLVVDPIAISFDEDGRCYVVEMRDYSERRPERLGRIRRLEDSNGAGRFDQSTVFAADMPWPTAVICWDGGVFVGATPDIIYFKDTNGDGVADIREPIFTGFAADYAPFATNKLNVQALMNSFNWSLDNRIHGATSFNGGKVKRVDSSFVRDWLKRADVTLSPGAAGDRSISGRGEGGQKEARTSKPETRNDVLDLRGRDFSFDPRTLEMRAESGGGQHGMSFDNRGRKYVCSNSSHLQTLMYEERYAARNPFFSMPRALVDIAIDGGAAPVFRISPDEPWRVIRTQWRVSGLVPGPIEGGGKPSGYFTGATGVTIYRGDAFGSEFVGNAFVGDAGGNLVHRKLILPDGVGVKGVRPADETNVEFLASTDNWFRPVQMANAPDGCLYICDMYREVIEHPWSLPESIKKHLDLNSGNDRGRIYRVVPENFKRRPLPRLGKANSAELVTLLTHTNGWHRDTAARLLYERQDKAAIQALTKTVELTHFPLAVAHALHALNGQHRLREEQVRSALLHSNSVVREHGLKLAEPFLPQRSNGLPEDLRRLIERFPDQEDAFMECQLGLTLSVVKHELKLDLLKEFLARRIAFPAAKPAKLPQNEGRTWLYAVMQNAITNDAFKFFEAVSRDSRFGILSPRAELLGRIASMVGAQANSNEIAAVVDFAGAAAYRKATIDVFETDVLLASRIIVGLDEGLRQRRKTLRAVAAVPSLKSFYDAIRRLAIHPRSSGPEETLLEAIRAFSTAPYDEIRTDLMTALASAAYTSDMKKAVVAAMAKAADPRVGADLLESWALLTQSIRIEIIAALAQRPERIRALLAAIEKGLLSPAELSVAQQAQLRSHRDPAIREQAEKILGRAPTTTRQSVVDVFQPALALRGSAVNGAKTFQARCATCHKLGTEGHVLGPDLATVKNAGKEKILVNILDPNREVNSNYLGYSVETKDGESFTGLIVNESANSVTLRLAGSSESVVPRANIASMQSQGLSLMPEGLEEGLSAQDMADLLEFILAH